MKTKNQSHKRKIVAVLAAIFFYIIMTVTAYAAEVQTLETVVYNGDIYIYVRGISAVQPDSMIQIGNTICPAEQISVASFNNLENFMRTLILVDNSKSVPEKNHADIQEILHQITSASMQNEQIRIGTFSKEITYLCEYTNNHETLNNVIDEITYNDQDTYLGDVLYTMISQLKAEQATLYTRIIVLSDGADDQSIGYPNEEVRTYIEKAGIPIYSIGIPSKNNASELETMFSFSRAAKADSFLLDGNISNEDIVQSLLMDQNGVCIKITPNESLKDGSTKHILLKLNTAEGAYELTTSADMPFGTGEKEEIEIETDTVPETNSVSEPSLPVLSVSSENNDNKSNNKDFSWIFIIWIIVTVILLIVAVLLIAIFVMRKKKNQQENQQQPEEKNNSEIRENVSTNTEYDFMSLSENSEDNVRNLWDNTPIPKKLTLKRLDNPNIFYKVPIKDIIRIGRENTDILIEDSKVSRLHCEIIQKVNVLYIKDCNSTNKTYYEGIAVKEEIAIVNGGKIKIGSYSYRIEIEYG